MAKFLNIDTKQIFENEDDFRKSFPNTAFPSVISEKCLPTNIVFLYDGIQPSVTEKQIVTFDGVECKNGVWFTKWIKTNRFSSKIEETKFFDKEVENKWREIIEKRNQLLSESDWIVVKSMENGVEIPTQWKNYRKLLRDITLNFNDPNKVVFPSKP